MKKKTTTIAILIITLASISGCASDKSHLVKAMGKSSRQDIFQEVSGRSPVPPGYADLRIVSSLKTHMPGVYSAKDIHGTADYKLLLNIDGQAVEVVANPREERRELHAVNDPEEGHGMRYLFQKEVRLRSGVHKILISLPHDDVAVEQEVELADGSQNTLLLEPTYMSARNKRRIGFYTNISFKEGIKGFWVKFNGKKS